MYAVLNLKWKPYEFAELDIRNKAFTIACIKEKMKEEDKIRKDLEKNQR